MNSVPAPPAVPPTRGPALIAAGTRLALVCELSEPHRREILAAGSVETHPAGRVFCNDHRRTSDAVYYLLRGRAAVTLSNHVVREIEAAPDGVLEAFHVPGHPCEAVRALSDVEVLRLPVGVLRRYVNLSKLIAAAALPEVVEIGVDDSDDGLELALSIGVLSRLPTADLQRLLQRAQDVPYRAGDTVIVQGEPGDCCYIVKSGTLEVDVARRGGARYRVAFRGPGDCVGEEALLAGAPRGASVRMRTDGVLMRVAATDFAQLVAPPYLNRVSWREAAARVGEGAAWLDTRNPEEFQRSALPEAINVPEALLRLRASKLDRRRHYVIVSNDPRRSAFANFVLAVAGLDVCYLDDPLANHLPTGGAARPLTRDQASAVESEADSRHASSEPAGDADIDGDSASGSVDPAQVRAIERQRYVRRLRKMQAVFAAEAEARVRVAIREVEDSYLHELENKHRQVLDLKRKVAKQQRELWKMQQALARHEARGDSGSGGIPDLP